MRDEIIKIIPPALTYELDDKVFCNTDDEGNIIGEPYSHNDFVKELLDISGVNESLLGNSKHPYESE